MKHPARVLLASCILLLSACAALSGKHDEFAVYTPRLSLPSAADATPQVGWQLLIETPRASAALDTARIAIMPSPGVLEVYPSARWRDPAALMLRSLILQAFEESGRIGGVSGSSSGLSADYSLAIELRDFQIEINNGSAQAAIRLTAKLFDHRSNRIIASRAFQTLAPATQSDIASAIPAFEQALDHLLPELVSWTLEKGQISHAAVHTPATPAVGTKN